MKLMLPLSLTSERMVTSRESCKMGARPCQYVYANSLAASLMSIPMAILWGHLRSAVAYPVLAIRLRVSNGSSLNRDLALSRSP
jgi:hypothetical protein